MDPRHAAILAARELLAANPVYLDTETTGLEWSSEIVEICVIDTDAEVLVDQLVRPTIPIPIDATRVHGISNMTVANEPSWPAAWPAVERAMAGRALAIYNAEYDLARMRYCHRRHGLEWRDVSGPAECLMKLYARYNGEWDPARRSYRWLSLQQAARGCGIALPQVHRARQDAELARAVLIHMAGETA
jgi:DNA polymerase III epsilon subunit-like protein